MKSIAITIGICVSTLTLKAQQPAELTFMPGVDISRVLIPQLRQVPEIISAPKLSVSALRLTINLPQDKDMIQMTQAKQTELNNAQKELDEEKQNEIVTNSISVTGNYDLINLTLEDLQKEETKTVESESKSLTVKVVPLKEDVAETTQAIVATEVQEIPVKLTFEIHKNEVKQPAIQTAKQATSLTEKLQNASYVDVNERIPVSIRRENGSVIQKYASTSSN